MAPAYPGTWVSRVCASFTADCSSGVIAWGWDYRTRSRLRVKHFSTKKEKKDLHRDVWRASRCAWRWRISPPAGLAVDGDGDPALPSWHGRCALLLPSGVALRGANHPS